MARLATLGAEDGETLPGVLGTAPTIETTSPRSGSKHWRAVSNVQSQSRRGQAKTAGVAYFHHVALRVSGAWPTPTVNTMFQNSNNYVVKITNTGLLRFYRPNGTTQIGTDHQLVLGQYHVVEVRVMADVAVGAVDELECRVDGITVGAETGDIITAAGNNVDVGPLTVYGASTVVEWDDFIINDSTGTTDNSWVYAAADGVLDTFDRADENPVSQGGKWLGVVAGGHVAMQVLANRLRLNAATFVFGSAVYDLVAADVEAWVTVSLQPGHLVRPWVRVTNHGAAPSGYFVDISAPNGQIVRVTAGAQTSIGPSFAVSVAAGDKIGLEAVGSTIRAWKTPVGGSRVTLATVTDTTHNSGRIGISTNSPTVGFDDFGGGVVKVLAPDIGSVDQESATGNQLIVALVDPAGVTVLEREVRALPATGGTVPLTAVISGSASLAAVPRSRARIAAARSFASAASPLFLPAVPNGAVLAARVRTAAGWSEWSPEHVVT